MNMPDIRRYEMLLRVKEFGVAHADVFGVATAGGELFATVAQAADKVTEHGVTQTHRATAGDRLSTKKIAADALRALLLKIRRTAHAMTPDTAGLDGKFVVPRSHGDQRLLLAARGFLEDAMPLRDQFVAHQLPATFLDDLQAAVGTFEAAIQAHVELREARAAARVGIAEALDAGGAAVDRLDALVTNVFEQQHETLAEWHSVRHVSHVSIPYPNRKRPAEPPAAPAPKAA
jgi:hypothetical protein